MSDELNEGSGGRGVAGHNVENRKKILNNSLAETYRLDSEIASLTEKHLKSLREAKSAIKKRIREDLSLPAAVFNARYASYKLEAKAIALNDEVTMDAIREMNEMAPIGSQIDMLKAVDDFEDKNPPSDGDDDTEEEECEEEDGEEAAADAGDLANQESAGEA